MPILDGARSYSSAQFQTPPRALTLPFCDRAGTPSPCVQPTDAYVSDSWIADSSGNAYSGTLLGGYDWWLGPQWSLGILAVLSASTSATLQDKDGNDTGYRFNALSAGLEYALTLH